MKNIFKYIDSLTADFYGLRPFGVFWYVSFWRKYLAVCVIISSFLWAILGWDSTWLQIQPYIDYFVSVIKNPSILIQGGVPFDELWQESKKYYGIGNHWSASTLYGLVFILLSNYLEKVGIKKSLNFFTTTSFLAMNVGIFEILYNILYAHFQHQPWTIQFVFPQARNLILFTLFTVVGILTFVYLCSEGYRPNLNKFTIFLFVISVGTWLLWVLYPFPITYITVETTTGTWTNSPLFPQTMYAVDVDPTDGVAVGDPYFVENNLLHGVNLLAKIIFTMSFLLICMVKKLDSQ